jgi:hypothetical protein
MDTDAIEELARDGKMSEKSIRQAKAIEADQARYYVHDVSNHCTAFDFFLLFYLRNDERGRGI